MKEVKIKSIKKLPNKYDRYDLTVSSTNNFFANGILIHNTSHIVGNLLVKKPKNGIGARINIKMKERELKGVLKREKRFYWQRKVNGDKIKAIKEFVNSLYTVGYGNVTSSRGVIKNQYINRGPQHHFYGKDIWGDYGKLLYPYLLKGMTVYSEICGYVDGTATPIQKYKKTGQAFDYGCEVGKSFIMPYRITFTDEDGVRTEWNVMEVYGWTLNLIKDHPELKGKVRPIDILYHGTLADLYPEINVTEHWNANVLKAMINDTEHFGMELDEPLCKNKVPREGIVLRIDDDEKAEAFKLKTLVFLDKQDKAAMDAGDVDIEMQDAYGDM